MKHTFFYFIIQSIVITSLLASCADFFEEDISDKTIQVICPSDNALITSNKLSFAWSEEEGVEKYHVIIVSPSFDNAQHFICDTILSSHKMELQLPKGDYQWSIQAENFGYKSLTNYLTFKITADEE